MPIEQLNPEVWKLVGRMDGLWTRDGDTDFGWGTVPTKCQTLTAAANLGVYKLVQGDQSLVKDYYLVAGDLFHGIQGSPQQPGANWVSVGFYCNYMRLALQCLTPSARVFTFGPNSSVETANIGFSIGGSLSAGYSENEGAQGEAGLNASVSISFSASEVQFRASPPSTSVEWYTRLPHVGWISPAIPANPGIAAYGGYLWNPAVIFEVPQDAKLSVAGKLEADFEYNWTRGIRRRWFTPIVDLQYHPEGGAPALAEPRLPTLVEQMHALTAAGGKDGETDTFISVLARLGILSSFGDSTLQQLVVVPTNKAIAEHFAANPPLALQWSGVQASRWWADWVDARIHNLPPGGSGSPALTSGVRRSLAETDRIYPCADGILVVTDDYERSTALAPVVRQLVPA